MKRYLTLMTLFALVCANQAYPHCQMPCGIYHDDMVFDQIDQYVETMYKGISVLNSSKFGNVKEKNEFIRWVIQKEKASDECADIITTYFLQQKIKPDEEDTVKRLVSAHNLLFLLVQIKQHADIKIVESFADEWEDFKQMFHVAGYECEIEQLKMRKRQHELQKRAQEALEKGKKPGAEKKDKPGHEEDEVHSHDGGRTFHHHDHSHDHEHSHHHHHHEIEQKHDQVGLGNK